MAALCYSEVPTILPDYGSEPYTIKLELNEANIVRKSTLYFATNIWHDFKPKEPKTADEQSTTTTDLQATSSSIRIPGLSDHNCESSAPTKDCKATTESDSHFQIFYQLQFGQ